MKKLKNQFLEVSDALSLGNPAIPEKDYWVVALLAQLVTLNFDTHQMVFSGGTALAKSNVRIFRMSEDVDIKLIPTAIFNSLARDKRKAKRKDDPTLVRHIYDIHCINIDQHLDFEDLVPLFQIVLQEDVRRFGNQHSEFVINPIQELQLGLKELEFNPLHYQRLINFVIPMVFNTERPNFDTCFASFKNVAQSLMINN